MYILNWSPVSFLGKSYLWSADSMQQLKKTLLLLRYLITYVLYISSMYSIGRGRGVSPQAVDL